MIRIRSQPVAGFTLIELFVSLSIISILICLGFSLKTNLVEKNQIKARAEDVKSAIAYARMHALNSGEALVLSHLPNTPDWSQGMMLFVDNRQHQYVTPSQFLHEWHWKQQGIHLTWRGFQSQDHLIFTPKLSQNAVNGTFILTDTMNQRRTLIVNRLGRVKSS
ncbi:MAG: GspH/FimT family pseudopilin [Legionellales bacterium]|nr:GspH/FimT family pseudopilin [Legionellales bacterium]